MWRIYPGVGGVRGRKISGGGLHEDGEGERSQGWERGRWRGDHRERAGLHPRGTRVWEKTSTGRGGELAGGHASGGDGKRHRREETGDGTSWHQNNKDRMPSTFHLLFRKYTGKLGVFRGSSKFFRDRGPLRESARIALRGL